MTKETKSNIKNYKYKAELTKWTEEKRVKKPKFYLLYSLIILCLAYIVDEIASGIFGIIQTDAALAFFPDDVNGLTIVMTLASGISIFSFLFRTLADKYGRKPFLYINLLGMASGMFFCFIAPNIVLYIIGLVIIFFFTPCDIQVLYIVETSSERRRALNLAFAKAIGVAGISLVSVFKSTINVRGWQGVFLIPAIIGLVVGLLALFFVKETDVFIDNRIKVLKTNLKASKQNAKQAKVIEEKKNDDSGIIPALKYMFNKKILLWLFIVLFTFSIAAIAQSNFAVVLKPTNEIYEAMGEVEYGYVVLMYPVSCAITIVLNGLISDIFGRKKAGIFDTIVALLGIIYFLFGARINWNPFALGILLGAFIGGYLSGLDTINVICTEISPTGMRSSIMSIISIANSAGTSLGTGLLLLFREFIPSFDMSVFLMVLVPPMLAISLYILLKKIPETKGVNFELIDANGKK